jgi:tRNA(Arg) A34 adenosine deaminase TadA
MCLGAIYWARPDKVYFANTHADAARIGFDDMFIYEEIALPIKERKIPMIQMLREEALSAFWDWQKLQDKIHY